MDNLTQLLDERWPLNGATDKEDAFWKKSALRDAFKEGYNARIAEEKKMADNIQEYDLKKVLDECRKMIQNGNPLNALRLYKVTTGSSISEAKLILNL